MRPTGADRLTKFKGAEIMSETKKAADKGTKKIFKRGKFWWIRFHKDGKRYQISSKSELKTVAEKLLKRLEGEAASGKTLSIDYSKIRWDELAEDFLRDYRVNGKKSLPKAERSVDHLKKHFGGRRAVDITTDAIRSYTDTRKAEGAANATVNRELAALKRSFNLAKRANKIQWVPGFEMLPEDNARTGFIGPEQFHALRNALPANLKGIFTLAFMYGLRRGELLNLTWKGVDLDKGRLRLEPKDTKNKKGRTIVLKADALEMLTAQKGAAEALGCASDTDHVFRNNTNTGPLKDYRGAWEKACKEVGLEGLLFHDLRRSAVRNMVRGDISEHTAMKISGHRTRAVFDRYDVVDEKDLEAAADKIAETIAPVSPQVRELKETFNEIIADHSAADLKDLRTVFMKIIERLESKKQQSVSRYNDATVIDISTKRRSHGKS